MKVDNKHTFGFIPEKKTKKGNSKPEEKKTAVAPAQTPEDEQEEKAETE